MKASLFLLPVFILSLCLIQDARAEEPQPLVATQLLDTQNTFQNQEDVLKGPNRLFAERVADNIRLNLIKTGGKQAGVARGIKQAYITTLPRGSVRRPAVSVNLMVNW